MSEAAQLTDVTDFNATETQAPSLYDADAVQVVEFRDEDDQVQGVVGFNFGPQDDDLIIARDEAAPTTLVQAGKRRSIRNLQSDKADVELFDLACTDLSGYEDLPSDWKAQLEAERKVQAARQWLEVYAFLPSRHVKKKGLLKFGKANSNNVIELAAVFNSQELRLKHYLKPKTDAQREKFQELVGGLELAGRDMELPSNMRKLGEFYYQIIDRTEGYAGRVPVHHRALVVSERFQADLEQIRKK